jgi:predicted acylesterase/phospholipase RssA
VTSDLVRGEAVVREQGDCVDAVIESITLPMFAQPLLREGRALVDGGLLNNLPTDLLIAQQMEVVIGVDVFSSAVTFDLHDRPSGKLRRPGVMELLLRIAEIQHERVSSLGAMQADLLLQVDVGRFALLDFAPARARALAAEGERAAEENVEKLRSLLPATWRGRA